MVCLTMYCFDINYPEHPQFKYVENYDKIISHIKEEGYWGVFKSFFIADLIWPVFLLLFIHGFVTGFKNLRQSDGVNWYFLSTAIMAYFMDVREMILYLDLIKLPDPQAYLPEAILTKDIFYALIFAWGAYGILIHISDKELQS